MLDQKKIAEVAGEQFALKTTSRGSVQLNIANMKEYRDIDRCRLLVVGYDALREAGFEAEVRLSYRTQDGPYIPWPCIWVNEPRVEASDVKALKAEMEALRAHLANQAIGDAPPL